MFDLKKFAVDDGPGIRTTIFFKGCPLHCWWCHNPEGQASRAELMYRNAICIGCHECVETCPRQAITETNTGISVDRKKCSICGRCCSKCPTGALAIAGKEMSPEEILEEIQKDAAFFEESEGGITVSGGEPFSQPKFLKVFLGKCKRQNIHTALDTCGYVSSKYVEGITDRVDLFLYDIKLMDEKKHRKYTGVSNRAILRNLKKLAVEGRSILVRFPVIPGINDDIENVRQTAEFVSSCRVKKVNLLPYHRAGIDKYKALDRPYKMGNTRSPSDKQLKQIKQTFETCGLKAKIGGG